MARLTKEMIERAGKRIVPEGHALDVDRSFDAAKRLDPSKPEDWKDYRKLHSRVDIKGFDTRKEKEPSIDKVLTGMDIGYIEREPERFVRDGMETRKLIDDAKDSIVDRKSLERAVKEQWMKDPSLKNFFIRKDGVEPLTERDWEALFKTKHVQDIVRKNIMTPILSYIKRSENVEDKRALAIYEQMPLRERQKLITRIIRQKGAQIFQVRPAKTPSVVGRVQRVRRAGRIYTRTVPRRWSRLEEEFIRNNSRRPITELFKLHNELFEIKRTRRSVSNKLYRVR